MSTTGWLCDVWRSTSFCFVLNLMPINLIISPLNFMDLLSMPWRIYLPFILPLYFPKWHTAHCSQVSMLRDCALITLILNQDGWSWKRHRPGWGIRINPRHGMIILNLSPSFHLLVKRFVGFCQPRSVCLQVGRVFFVLVVVVVLSFFLSFPPSLRWC